MNEYKYNGYVLKELPEDYIGYFGTAGRPGHSLITISRCDSQLTKDWDIFFDGEWLFAELIKEPNRFQIIRVYGLTIVGIPYSLDDDRGNSKTLFICGGNRDIEYIANKIEECKWVSEIFHKIADKLNKSE